jgi:hypothetical protein
MDAESLSAEGKFNRSSRSIDKDLSCGDNFARHLSLLCGLGRTVGVPISVVLIFEQMFEK